MRGKNQKELLEIKNNAHYIKNSMKAYKNNAKPRWQTKGRGQRWDGAGRERAESLQEFQHTKCPPKKRIKKN